MKTLLALLLLALGAVAAPFEIKEGDRVLLLGDALLERENTYGDLELRMHEQFPKVRFTVRNLSWSGETPKGWSRASFDPPAAGWQRLKEQIAEVRPTVVILGFGMAASLQEMTDRSGDTMLNPDPVRYGAEPMTAVRFKKEMGELMDAIDQIGNAPEHPQVRYILLSPIRHEDLRKTRPGLPDPAPHNALLEQYAKAIEGLATERKAVFCPADPKTGIQTLAAWNATHNGITLTEQGYAAWALDAGKKLEWGAPHDTVRQSLRAAILRKNELFFFQFRPANSTYLFGFRKHEQGQNAAEMPKFTPLIEAEDKKIDELKRSPNAEAATKAEAPAVAAVPEKIPAPTFSLADGLELTLWADTDLVGKPVGMNWDAAGRLWIACSPVYPMITPGAHPDDKVVVLEDTDHDGKADKSTTFATNLLVAQGVAPDFGSVPIQAKGTGSARAPRAVPGASPGTPAANGGGADPNGAARTETIVSGGAPETAREARALPITAAYVSASTELYRLEDTNGDGVADERRIVFSGFGTEDTHHTIHTLRWGPDGRLYFNQSIYIHSHVETPWGMVRLNSGGIFAYDPRTERLEVTERGFINTWGHAWDQWGQEFASDGAGFEGLHWLVPGAMYRTYEGARRILSSISPGSYPKYASLELIQSPLFPADWQGDAITCDFRAHRVVRFKIEDLGQRRNPEKSEVSDQKSAALSGYITKELQPPITTNDAAFRPIDVKLGPDGALYIADWTNPIINHGEVDFRDPRRDHVHGRIWRLAPKGSTPLKWESLVGKTATDLGEAALSANSWETVNALQTLSAKLLRAEEETAVEWAARKKLTRYGEMLAEVSKVVEKHLPQPTLKLGLVSMLQGGGLFNGDGRNNVGFEITHPEDPNKHAWYYIDRGDVWPKLLASADPRNRAAWTRFVSYECERLGRTVMSTESREKIRAWLVASLQPLIRDTHPRVRVEAMRALARIPTTESAALVLEAALNVPGGEAPKAIKSEDKATSQFNQPTFADTLDPYYGYAAWLSVNDLAPQVMEWVEKSAAGTAANNPAPEASRDAMIAYALQALRPEQTAPLLAKIIAKHGVPKDGSGPWIELIGQAGGPAELRLLLNGLLAGTVPDGDNPDPLMDRAQRFTSKDANRRAAAALVVAARRGVNPANPPYSGWQFYLYAPREAIDDVLRLAGLWKQNFPAAIVANIPSEQPSRLDAVFESLRTLGTEDSANYLAAFLNPALEKQIDNPFLRSALEHNSPAIRRRALGALSTFRPDVALAALRGVLDLTPGDTALPLWRELFSSEKFTGAFLKKMPALTKEQAAPALRAARELGKKGDKLVAALTPLTGAGAAAPGNPADFVWLVDFTKKNGNAAGGELVYRRAASACTVCHAIGGAGGHVGPDLTTIGASAPLDYLVESVMVPNAKVKEGFNAVAVTLKGGRAVSGVQARETDRELVLRDATGAEQVLAKSEITARENIGSLMPPGLTAAMTDREKADLFAFLSQLGKPGPFDATKGNVARTWEIFGAKDIEPVVTSAAKAGSTVAKSPVHALPLVDGRLPKAQLTEALQLVPDAGDTVLVLTRFTSTAPSKSRFGLQGVTKAWLDGAPLAIASDPNPVVDLAAGNHTLAIKLDVKGLPEVLRAECADVRFLNE